MTSSDLLFGITRPTNRMFVHSSSNASDVIVFGVDVEVREVGHDRQHAGRREAERPASSCRLNSESPSASSQRADVGGQLAAAVEAQLDELLVHAEEVLRRRDVVVHEHHPARQRVRGAGRARADREVMDQQVVGPTRADHVAIVASSDPRAADRRSRRRSPTRSRRPAARAGCRAPRGRWRRRSPSVARTWWTLACRSRGSRAGLRRPAIRARLRRRQVPLAPREQPGQRLDRGWRRSRRPLLEPLEHVEVLPLDDRPRVVPPEELAAVAAEPRVQRPVRLERVQRLDELLVALVVEPAVAADALSLAARRTAPLASTGLPSAQASSATIDRLSNYDGMISRSAAASASNLSRRRESRDAGCADASGSSMTALPISTRSRPRGNVAA